MTTKDVFFCGLCGNGFSATQGFVCPTCGSLLCAACAKLNDCECKRCKGDLELLE